MKKPTKEEKKLYTILSADEINYKKLKKLLDKIDKQ